MSDQAGSSDDFKHSDSNAPVFCVSVPICVFEIAYLSSSGWI